MVNDLRGKPYPLAEGELPTTPEKVALVEEWFAANPEEVPELPESLRNPAKILDRVFGRQKQTMPEFKPRQIADMGTSDGADCGDLYETPPEPPPLIPGQHTPGPWETYDPHDACCGSCCTVDGCHESHPSGECCLGGPPSEMSLRFDRDEDARLCAAAPDYFAGVEQMLLNEQCGGDGWWKGWEMLKAAHAKATGSREGE